MAFAGAILNGIERILVVGVGSIGRRHLRVARQLNPEATIYALRRAAPAEQPEQPEQPEHADRCITAMEAALAFAPQIVVISNPATQHIVSARPFAAAGAHLLIEKPLADCAATVGDLLEVSRNSGSIVMTGYNLRFLPSLQRLRALLEGGRIGRILSVRAEVGQYLPSWRPGSDYRSTVSARRDLGGGALLELSHEIDYLRWLFGEITWVQATLRRQGSLQIDVEDTALLTLGFAARATQPELIASLNIDFIRRDSVRQCTVIGEEGTLRWNALTHGVEIYEPEAGAWRTESVHPAERDDSYIAEWRHFMACVRGNLAPAVSGEDGVAVLRVIDAARQSSQTQRAVATACA